MSLKDRLVGHDAGTESVELRFGAPGNCPTCRGPATLTSLDLEVRASHHHCPTCRRSWWVSEQRPDEPLTTKPTETFRHH